MISHLEIGLRELRRWFSRSEWMIRVLGCSRSDEPTSNPGLVIIQIDGLARPQLDRALVQGRMPFLQSLLDEEHYELHSLYSGLPSSTPAFQAELFYGVKGAVPTFSFLDRLTNEVHAMYEPTAAIRVEKTLADHNEPLLTNGSAYCNIYAGGAEESHFCAASFGWGGLLRAANPFVLLFFLVVYSASLLRTFALFILELALAVKDFIGGYLSGRDFYKELKFVAARVLVCVLLRELVTIGSKIDIARGVPIIHLNLLGYDEQAHRRGPSSKFAHWSLKGLDKVVRSLWQASHNSKHRHYDVWIYSDHGQEDVLPYPRLNDREVEEAIAEVFKIAPTDQPPANISPGTESQRAKFLGASGIRRLLPIVKAPSSSNANSELPIVAAMGPMGQVYSPRPLSFTEESQIAEDLVIKAKIPLVLAKFGEAKARVWMGDKQLILPEDRALIFGDQHPFLDSVADDMLRLVHHKNAGDFVICGWHHGIAYQSFRLENGSHAGFGENETHAFALLPGDTYLRKDNRSYLRPLDLRQAALHRPHASGGFAMTAAGRNEKTKNVLRIMTYNVHSCIGMDGKVAPDRVARVIARHEPDIVCLQELDVDKGRTGSIDQAHRIAQLLEMEFHFHPTIHFAEERYGDAVLTHLPMKLIKADLLPTRKDYKSSEPRGAIWVEVEVNGKLVNIINTHLDVRPGPRREQLDSLLGENWLRHPACKGAVILCGDLNTIPSSPLYKSVTDILFDTHAHTGETKADGTFFTRFPKARIDYIFASDSINNVSSTQVPNNELTRTASDHFPVITDIAIDAPD